jgi:hypothetical protein
MRLHPRFFNSFLMVTAAMSALAILFFGIRYQANQEDGLRDNLGNGLHVVLEPFATVDTPGDSVRVIDYAGRWVLVQFWSTWSEPSLQALNAIPVRHDLITLAAYVRDDSASVARFIAGRGSMLDHRFVLGTRVFQEYQFPGVPSFVLFDPDGRIHHIGIGFDGPTTYADLFP